MLPGVRELVPCEIASYNEVDFGAETVVAAADPIEAITPDAAEVFARIGEQNPLVTRYQETRDGRPYKWSDLITRRELHETELYRRGLPADGGRVPDRVLPAGAARADHRRSR